MTSHRPRPGAPGGSNRPRTARTTSIRPAAKPASGRVPARQPADDGGDERDERAARMAQPKSNPALLYGGIGGGVVVVLVLIVAMSGGSGGGSKGGDTERLLEKAISSATSAAQSGDARKALDIAEKALADDRLKKYPRYKSLQNLAANYRRTVGAEGEAASKTADLRRRLEAAKKDSTAMKQSKQFLEECKALLQEYQMTSSGNELRGMREDLLRWSQTEGQSDWQKDYNAVKDRIEKQILPTGQFGTAAKEWKHFGEASNDPLLKSRIDHELATIDEKAKQAAQGVVDSAGSGADARKSLEDAMSRFGGTAGQDVIKAKLRILQ